jgi:ATP-dependent Clp protease protease subunit
MRDKDKCLQKRIVVLDLPISNEDANEVIAKLLFLQSQSARDPITLAIDSPGGSVGAGMAIIDTIKSLEPQVHTSCIGQAHGIATIILAAGSRGNRTAVSNATITFGMIAIGEMSATDSMDRDKQAEFGRMTRILVNITSRMTGMTTEEVRELFASGKPLTATKATRLGIVDCVVEAPR